MPAADIAAVYTFAPDSHQQELRRPLFVCSVSAGFPSPADDYIEGELDLNRLLVDNPPATFFVRVAGDSMTGAGIHHHDILVVDRSLAPTPGKVVIAVVDGELTVKRFCKDGDRLRLAAANPDYPDLVPAEESSVTIWGVVVHVIHSL
ncbi:LexA family protein [Desulfurivibrio dismutans]|uniref:LexA family protein n=1 Tax=Desulfurivibrio dismutans TaxID=1398908 RepID=UPI003D65BCF2